MRNDGAMKENPNGRGAEHTGAHPAEIDRELRGERTGRELREREPFLVFVGGVPAARLLQVAAHALHEHDRPAEAPGAESEKVARERGDGRRAGVRHLGHRRTGLRWSAACITH